MADLKKLQDAENISLEQPNTYADQLNDAVSKTGRKYEYDWNTDQLYQDYKNTYMTEAQKARANVINAGKGLTGGFQDTYVESVADQRYSDYLTEINRLAPAFENLAYAQHQMEEENALKQAQMVGMMDNNEYAQYRDALNDLYRMRNYELGNYKYDVDYEREQKALADKIDTANKKYEQQLYKDKLAEAAAARGGGGGGGRGGYGYGGGGGDNGTGGIYNAHGSTHSGNLDWVQVPGLGRLSWTEVQNYANAGWLGYWRDSNGQDHYTLTSAGRNHFQNKNTNNKITHTYAGVQK